LNILSGYIPSDERIITIEDAAELNLQQDHVVRLETKVANIDGKGSVTIRDLVRNSLRMRQIGSSLAKSAAVKLWICFRQ